MKTRKLLISILIGFCVCFTSATLFTACGETHTHSYISQTTTEATCTEKGLTTYTCSCGDTYTEEILALGHDEETHQAQSPTCTEIGWEAYETCSRCDYSTYVEILALGHDYIYHEAKVENCTEIGWNEYNTCSRCDYSTYREIPKQHNATGNNGYCLGCNMPESTPGLNYSKNSDGTYRVTGIGSCAATNIVIGFYNNKNVTSIGEYAFYKCCNLTSVVIPDSVTSIGGSAFSDCSSLTSVYITDIETWCNISFGNGSANPLCYAEKLYLNNELITELVIPDSVTSIGSYAFSGCDSLTSVVIGDSVTSIGNCAFSYCSSLTSVVIGDSVTSIGSSAFYYCDRLTSVVIPDSVTSIGSSAFSYCDGLTSVYITDIETWCNISFGNVTANPLSHAEKLYLNNELITELVIPDSVTSIGAYAFRHCRSLTSITIPDSVTSIGDQAFEYCSSLTSVVIGDGVTSIGNHAFLVCSSLTSVVIGDGVTSIGEGAFSYCSRLTSITFKDTSTWYRTTSSSYWQNKKGGTSTSVTDSSTNATNFKSTYQNYYWYKL